MFINKYSWKSFLSSTTKEIKEENGFYFWKIKNKLQLVKDKPLQESDIPLLKELKCFNFFYFSEQDIDLLKSITKISKEYYPNIIIKIDDISYSGKKFSDIRTAINKNSKLNLSAESNFRSFDDIIKMIKRWSEKSGAKYFQDRSGKNKFYFKNNFHLENNCIFLYDKDDLISFSVVSPAINEHCSYIIGKTLCLDYPGLSEYADYLAIEQVKNSAKYIDLGGGSKQLRKYKLKFPNSYEEKTYNGSFSI